MKLLMWTLVGVLIAQLGRWAWGWTSKRIDQIPADHRDLGLVVLAIVLGSGVVMFVAGVLL